MSKIEVKRGDTLSFVVRRKNEDGTPRTGEASNLRSQIRNIKDALIAEITITETDVPGDYLFTVPATETSFWVPGKYTCDIQFTDVDFVESSNTFEVVVEKDVTRNE